MQEQLISFKTAKLAKKKGYAISNQLVYDENLEILLPKDPAYPGWHDYAICNGICAAPTQSLLQKWLREIHNIHIEIDLDTDDRFYILKPYKYVIDIYQDIEHKFIKELIDSYEEALEIGLQEALKLI